jgi:hypothetical protein
MNVALMLKWIWRLYHEEDAIWARLLRAKYPSASDIFVGNSSGGSPFGKVYIRFSTFSSWTLRIWWSMGDSLYFG